MTSPYYQILQNLCAAIPVLSVTRSPPALTVKPRGWLRTHFTPHVARRSSFKLSKVLPLVKGGHKNILSILQLTVYI